MKPLARLAALAALFLTAASTAALAQAPSWAPPPDSARCPSKWGAGDERGSANHMKPQTVLNAARLIKTGEVIELSHVLTAGMPLAGGGGVCLPGNATPGGNQPTTATATKN